MKKRCNMQEIINNKMFKLVFIILISLSASLLSVYLMIGEITNSLIYITFFVSFLFYNIYIYKYYSNLVNIVNENKIYSYISVVLALIIFYEFKAIGVENIRFINNNLNFINHFHYLSLPGLIFIITVLIIRIKEWLKEFIGGMDSFEKKAYIFTSILVFITIFVIYLKNSFFYGQYDKVYSIDAGWIYSNLIPKTHYYDIRHPLMGILTFPIYAIVNFIFSPILKPIILQFINVQLLILVGIELKRITNNKLVYIFYIISFPTLLFFLFFEKYVICVFLLVTYLYNIFVNKQNSNKMLVLTVGNLPTNIFICVTEFFRSSKFKEKIKNIIYIGLVAILTIILTGRIHCLFNGYNEIIEMKNIFGINSYTTIEKINSVTKMIHGSLISIESSNQNGLYLWNNLLDYPSYFAILILIIILIAVVYIFREKNKKYYSFVLAFVFSFILFIVLNWAVNESPLFSICFSWAIIPLLIYGIDKILCLFKFNKRMINYFYYILFIIILSINIISLINIYKFTII